MSTVRNLPDAWRTSTRRAGPAAAVNVPSNRVTLPPVDENIFTGATDTYCQELNRQFSDRTIVRRNNTPIEYLSNSAISTVYPWASATFDTTQNVDDGAIIWQDSLPVLSHGGGGGGGIGGIGGGSTRWGEGTSISYTGSNSPNDYGRNPEIKPPEKSSKLNEYFIDIDGLRKDLNLSMNLVQIGNKLEVRVGLSDRNGVEYSFDSDFVELDP